MDLNAVVYELVASAPGRYFRCDRYGLMSAAACGRSHSAAPSQVGLGRLSGCIGCPTGAAHAGVVPVPVQHAEANVCVRCRRDPEDSTQYRSTRQGRVRMVRNGLLCVSCFNREREVVRGRNARNTRPRAPPLHGMHVGRIVDGQFSIVHLPAVKDAIEAALTVMKESGGRAMVAWASPRKPWHDKVPAQSSAGSTGGGTDE